MKLRFLGKWRFFLVGGKRIILLNAGNGFSLLQTGGR